MQKLIRAFAIASITAAALTGCSQNEARNGSSTREEGTMATLKVGDPAPPLTIEQWLKGDPVSGFERGKVYVVEFWATWCPPCVRAIPHLSELQARHPEVVVIGVAGSERRPAQGQPDTRAEKLTSFIEDQGDKMAYRVAFDSDRSMPRAWMEPAGRDGIPCSFIVDREGRIAWIGHPMQMDDALARAARK